MACLTITPPNTFYREGGTIPVIETPLSAVASVNEMMLQSYDGEIHVFPAVPDAWKEASYQI
jgi:alpha-L-fucosidase 2